MAINKVVYGDDTLIDLTSDTVTSATMLNGTTAHDASGTAITGSYTPVTPTSITPSNSSPVALTANTAIEPTTAGYAILSYDTITPSNDAPDFIDDTKLVKATTSGFAVESQPQELFENLSETRRHLSYYEVYTVNSYAMNPYAVANLNSATPRSTSQRLSEDFVYLIENSDGYLIDSDPTSVTPSSTPVSVSAGDIIQIGGSGVIVDSVPTPTSITPDNTNPPTLAQDGLYHSTSSGVAVRSITTITPSSSNPPSFNGGDYVYKSAISGGGYVIRSYSDITPSANNREHTSWLAYNSAYLFKSHAGYVYGLIPTGRNLFSYTTQPNRDSTSWYTVGFSSTSTTVYDADGTSYTTMLDENFAHFADGGEIVVDRACTIYIAGAAFYGRTSSGTVVYSGLRVLKNGSVISGTSITGASGTASPTFRHIEVSVAVGDVLKIQTKVSSTSSANHRITVNFCTD